MGSGQPGVSGDTQKLREACKLEKLKGTGLLKMQLPSQEDKGRKRRLLADGAGMPGTCETGILPEDIRDRGPKQQEDVNDAALRHPAYICLWGLPRALQVVKHLPKQGL